MPHAHAVIPNYVRRWDCSHTLCSILIEIVQPIWDQHEVTILCGSLHSAHTRTAHTKCVYGCYWINSSWDLAYAHISNQQLCVDGSCWNNFFSLSAVICRVTRGNNDKVFEIIKYCRFPYFSISLLPPLLKPTSWMCCAIVSGVTSLTFIKSAYVFKWFESVHVRSRGERGRKK